MESDAEELGGMARTESRPLVVLFVCGRNGAGSLHKNGGSGGSLRPLIEDETSGGREEWLYGYQLV